MHCTQNLAFYDLMRAMKFECGVFLESSTDNESCSTQCVSKDACRTALFFREDF